MTFNLDQEPNSFSQHFCGGEIATTYGIGKWLLGAIERGANHMIVVCDTFDYDNYLVDVMPDEDVHEVVARYRNSPMQKVMEVYWLGGDLNEQLEMECSFTYGTPKSPNAE